MSTLKTTYIQHPDATGPAIELTAAGTVALPLSGIGDLADVDEGSGAADGDVLTYDGSSNLWLPQAGLAGIGSNVVQTVKTDTFSTTSNSFVDVTGLTLTITPSSATSKILVLVNLTFGPANATAYRGNANLVRDSTTIATRFHAASDTSAVQPFAGGFAYLDSPATTNATTYKVQVASSESQTLQVGRSLNNSAAILSQIAAIEVAA